MILHCVTCTKHEFQDKTHGPNMRVANPMKNKEGSRKTARCTVVAQSLRFVNSKADQPCRPVDFPTSGPSPQAQQASLPGCWPGTCIVAIRSIRSAGRLSSPGGGVPRAAPSIQRKRRPGWGRLFATLAESSANNYIVSWFSLLVKR